MGCALTQFAVEIAHKVGHFDRLEIVCAAFSNAAFSKSSLSTAGIQKPSEFDLEFPVAFDSSMVTCTMLCVALGTRAWIVSAEAARARIAAKTCSRALGVSFVHLGAFFAFRARLG